MHMDLLRPCVHRYAHAGICDGTPSLDMAHCMLCSQWNASGLDWGWVQLGMGPWMSHHTHDMNPWVVEYLDNPMAMGVWDLGGCTGCYIMRGSQIWWFTFGFVTNLMVDSVHENLFFANLKSTKQMLVSNFTHQFGSTCHQKFYSLSATIYVVENSNCPSTKSSEKSLHQFRGWLKGLNQLLNWSWIQRWIQLKSPYLTIPIGTQKKKFSLGWDWLAGQ